MRNLPENVRRRIVRYADPVTRASLASTSRQLARNVRTVQQGLGILRRLVRRRVARKRHSPASIARMRHAARTRRLNAQRNVYKAYDAYLEHPTQNKWNRFLRLHKKISQIHLTPATAPFMYPQSKGMRAL